MKISTARRIIKEAKKGLVNHPQELVDKAHQVAHKYHDKVGAEKAAIASFVKTVEEDAIKNGLAPEAVEAKKQEAAEHAQKEVKRLRQERYAPKPVLATFHKSGEGVERVRLS